MADWLGYTLYVHGPWWIMRRNNAFVCWCLRHAGAWAYRDHDFGPVSDVGNSLNPDNSTPRSP